MYQTEIEQQGVSFLATDEWESLLTIASTENAFASSTISQAAELHNSQLSGENLKQALLAWTTPEVQQIIQRPDQRTLTPKELTEIRFSIDNWESAALHHDTDESAYLDYLKNSTGIDPDSPNIVQAFDANTEKAIAHTALAYAHLTEKESHLVSLWDTTSIIAHAIELYSKGLHPWWDFAVSKDFSSKSSDNVTNKASAPLFKDKDCPTLIDFFTKVMPKIFELREQDPKAALKIFPQSKNVETFNWRISKDKNGETVWIFEWYPGAYTPRTDSEDKVKSVVKNRSITKEERIVRAIVKFDKYGSPIIGLKAQKDAEGFDLPFELPVEPVDVNKLFERVTIVGNHDDMASSNNPFIFLKYLATNPQVREHILNFEKVHAQFGNADLVVSGMIGPDTIFFMDLDLETPSTLESDQDYVRTLLANQYPTHPTTFSNLTLFNNLKHAPIIHEFDVELVDNLPHSFRYYIYELFKTAEESGRIDITYLHLALKLLQLITNHSTIDPSLPAKTYQNPYISTDEIRILQRMLQCEISHNGQQTSHESALSTQERSIFQANRSSQFIPTHPMTMLTPTEIQILNADRQAKLSEGIPFRSYLNLSKKVADL